MGVIPWAPQLQNGDVAAKALMVDFDGLGHHLQPSAATSLRALAKEFEAVFGVPFTISEGFRDLPTQDYFWDLYQSGRGNPAAYPGTSSHGQGLAVDINSWVYGNSANTDRHRWLVDNAPRFGWSWELVGKPSGEPWHFNYVGGWSDWASGNITPFEEDDMFSDTDRQALNEARWLLGQIKPQTDKLDRIAVATDLVLWSTTDPSQGIRRMIANLSNLVSQVSTRTLSKEQTETALKDALAPFTATTIAAQTDAATARVSSAAAEVAKADEAQKPA